MRRMFAMACAATLTTAAPCAGALMQGPDTAVVRSGSDYSPGLLSPHPRIRSALERIVERSRLFRDETRKVAAMGRRIVVLTTQQVLAREGASGDDAFDSSQIAETVALLDPDSVIRTVVVVLNLGLLEGLGRELLMRRRELDDDIDRILIHEVYAHAVPRLLGEGICSDPVPGQRPTEACSIRRENAVRDQAGLGRRTDYGLRSLTIGRRLRF